MKNLYSKNIRPVTHSILVASLLVGLSGCFGGPDAVDPARQSQLAQFSTQDVEAQVAKVKSARENDNLAYYAPITFKQAQEYAYNALEMQKNKDDLSDIFDEVQKSKKILAKAYSTKSLVDKELAEVLSYKIRLDELHAIQLFKDEYTEILDNISEMIEAVDNDQGIESFSLREETLQKEKQLYSRMKISTNLHSVEAVLNSIDAEIAPKAFQKAKSTYDSAKFTINKFPDDEVMINKVSTAALNEALYAQTIEKETKKLLDIARENVEYYITDLHDKLIDLYNMLDSNDKFRTFSLESKFAEIKKELAELVKAKKELDAQNKILNETVAKNETTISDLKTQVDTFTKKNSDLEQKALASNKDILQAKDVQIDLKNKLFTTEKKVTELEATIVAMQKQKEVQESSAKSSEKSIQDLQKKVDDLNGIINKKNSDIKGLKDNNSKLSSQLEDKDIVIKTLKSEKANALKEASSAKKAAQSAKEAATKAATPTK